jgi:PAS domain S-box-containing protein
MAPEPDRPGDRDPDVYARGPAAAGTTYETPDIYRLLVDSVQDYAIFALDPEGRVASWNAGAQRIKGYSPHEILGRHFSVFYTPEELATDKPAHELRVAGGAAGRFEDEGWRVRKDGSRFWANVIITALRNEAGELVGFGKVTRDLTERRAAEQQAVADARGLAAEEAHRKFAEQRATELDRLVSRLREQTAEVERRRKEADTANRAKSDFLAAMSHELRTPLNAIGGYAELLRMGLRGHVTAEQTQDLDRIRSSQQHLLGIINDILNFTRIEAGQVTYDIAPVRMRVAIEAVSQMIRPLVDAKAVVFTSEPCSQEVVALADRSKLEQVMLNLLSNAVKFTDAGGRITLRCALKDERILVTVSDTGSGIPADKHEAIFEPFVQIGRTLSSQAEGTGLGLAISRDLARAMGGDLRVRSVVGQGSTFELDLPRAPQGEELRAAPRRT